VLRAVLKLIFEGTMKAGKYRNLNRKLEGRNVKRTKAIFFATLSY
jgi:hypothetical protein